MRRIVVAIDPAISVGEDSDETGLVVAGCGVDDHGYVIEDASGKFSPIEWARRAVALYRKWGADRIVAEANQGGLMVEQTVRTVDANVSFKSVHASRGKITRAEPIAALFEQGRAHLAGAFPELEDQLCTFEAGSSGSPDRLDAMVWAFTELMIEGAEPAIIEFYRQENEARMRGDVLDAKTTAVPMVKLLAPPDVSAVYLKSGRAVCVPSDRLIEMTEDDAKPLERAGWSRASAFTA